MSNKPSSVSMSIPWLLSIALAAAGAACGGGDDDGGGAPDSAVAGHPDAMAQGGQVPDPGSEDVFDWVDGEPNDDASHATPEGVLSGPIWAGFAMPYTQLDTDDDTDFFVFRTKDQGTLDSVRLWLCTSPNAIDMYLYQVTDQVLGSILRMGEGDDTGCVGVVDIGEGSTVLAADTVYVLEVRAQPGLTGTPTMYGA